MKRNANPDALLSTKLHVPRPHPALVHRPRLTERLEAGLRGRLTLVSAPAGYGKTTLVSEWIASHRRGGPRSERRGAVLAPGDHEGASTAPLQVAWLSLDEGDNDPTRFWTYFIVALQTVEASLGTGAFRLLQSPRLPPSQAILTALINEIAAHSASARIVLVLDDYHLIDGVSPASAAIHDALALLLRRLPPQLHLLVVTREDPPLPLARLRARGQLTELRAADLQFTLSEAAAFLNQAMGLDLSPDGIAALAGRTEGWIAGLQLAALALQGALVEQAPRQKQRDAASLIQSFTGSQRFVLDYLIEEVLEQQPESLQAFLLQTAVLDRLTGPLCDAVIGCAVIDVAAADVAVTGQDPGRETLETLERANLFIVPLDDERRWYRYHHLFADLLRQRLRQIQPERLPRLHCRASEWYEQNGFVDDAIDHALRGEHFERAACLIEEQLDANYERVDQATLQRWLAAFPRELVLSRPRLCILYAWNLFSSGQLDAADQGLRVAEKTLNPDTDQESPDEDPLSDTDRSKLVGRIAAIRSFIASYSNDRSTTIRYARQALEVLPEQERSWRVAALIALGDAYASQGQMDAAHEARTNALAAGKASGDPYILTIAHLRLAEILRQQGKLQQVLDLCERQFERAERSGLSESAIAGWLLGIWGEVLAELDDLDRAVDLAKRGVERTARSGDLLYHVMSSLCLVRVLFSSGDLTGAQEVIQSMGNAAPEQELPLWGALRLSAWHVRIWLAEGKPELASRWAQARGLEPDAGLAYPHDIESLAFARVLIAQGRLDEAAGLLQRLLEAAEAGGRISSVIEILLLQALASQAGGDSMQAMAALEHALTLAEPRGFVRAFADEGPPLARLLYQAAQLGTAPEYVRRLLAAFPVVEPEQTGAPHKASHSRRSEPLIEPLSDRELEVLALIAEGMTNPEIASRLFLALNTARCPQPDAGGCPGTGFGTLGPDLIATLAADTGLLPVQALAASDRIPRHQFPAGRQPAARFSVATRLPGSSANRLTL
jgi:LuxR family maltose regulon positive regulatory protein